ncbi:MAG: YciC family protein, partial [Nitrososphaerales archaeon]
MEILQPEAGVNHELSIGEVVSRTFELYRRNFVEYFLLFALVGVISGSLTTIGQHAFVVPTLATNPTPQQFFNWFPGFLGAVVPIAVLTFVVGIVFFPIAQGSTIKLASEQLEKGRGSLGESIRFAASKLLSIWALSILVGVIVFLGFIALFVPGVILAIMFALAFPVLIIENKGVLESMRKSRELVGDRWLKTFGTFLVLAIIVGISSAVASALSAPFGIGSPIVSGVLSAFYAPLFPILLAVYYYSNKARIAAVSMRQSSTAPGMVGQTSANRYCPACGAQLASPVIF